MSEPDIILLRTFFEKRNCIFWVEAFCFLSCFCFAVGLFLWVDTFLTTDTYYIYFYFSSVSDFYVSFVGLDVFYF
jgi:hypothetical protein